MKQLNLTLHYHQYEWIVQNDQLKFKARELDELDAKIKNYLTQQNWHGQVEINFYFDFENFPRWMRQYMPHYFNKRLILNL